MPNLVKEIKHDVDFVKSHTLQPKWYKVLKVFILLGFLAGYGFFFGWARTAVFLAVFLLLSLVVHMAYRIGTDKFTRSWLDLTVEQTSQGPRAKSIGRFYYAAIIFNALLAVLISQVVRVG